jgi:lipoprotein-releasing system permease protein
MLTIISPNGPESVMGTTPRIRDFMVVAIFKIGMSEYDENIIYMPLADAQEYFVSEEGVTALEVMVEDPDGIDTIKTQLAESIGPELYLQTWKDRNQAFFNALAVERNVMFLVLTMIILVAALNIISGLIMLVKDKGHDIAILRTMGATRGAIQRVFFITGAAIGVIGTLMGLLLGTVICLNVESIRKFVEWLSGVDPFNAEIYYLAQLPADMDAVQMFWITMMSLGLSFLATLYPSWRAAKLDPVEALRYE